MCYKSQETEKLLKKDSFENNIMLILLEQKYLIIKTFLIILSSKINCYVIITEIFCIYSTNCCNYHILQHLTLMVFLSLWGSQKGKNKVVFLCKFGSFN